MHWVFGDISFFYLNDITWRFNLIVFDKYYFALLAFIQSFFLRFFMTGCFVWRYSPDSAF
jgi:hypothetical protein